MKSQSFVFLTLVILLLFTAAHEVMADGYKIGPGDLIEINVWKNQDLTRQLVVLPDGTVRFPLIGQLNLQGQAAEELEQQVINKLKKFIPEPIVSVSVLQANSMIIYVIGKVNHPGRFEILKNIDVLQALAVAGGLNPFAREKEIKIFRKKDANTIISNFNYKEVSQGEKLKQNIMLQRGDVIVVR